MHVKQKKNRSGSISVVIVEKRSNRYKQIVSIGSSKNPDEITNLVQQGKAYIRQMELDLAPELDFNGVLELQKQERLQAVKEFVSDIDQVLLNGPQYILNRVFDSIGFGAISNPIFRNLVLARLSFPSSKKATVEYLKSYFDEDVDLYKIYRYLDILDEDKQNLIQDISVNHTLNIHGGTLGVLFYDVTTLYFETDTQDDLRKTGFSKDGKHSNPQIVLGLLVSADGCPLAYSINEGKKYEGHTLLPAINNFIERYKLEDFIVVADSGMLNNDNLSELEQQGYKYIIGARIKNTSADVKDWILSLTKQDGVLYSRNIDDTTGKRMIIGYTTNRAKKDNYNREKGIRRLQKVYKSGTITKDKITQRGYNKFLTISGNDTLTVEIDQSKIRDDECWDGLKGYITNTDKDNRDVVAAYNNLFNVEQSFRISKSKLEIRPIFHFNGRRIKAHIAICFVALKVYKELDRLLKMHNMNLSVDKVLDIARTIVTIKIKLNNDNDDTTNNIYSQTLFLTNRHKLLKPIFENQFWGDSKVMT